jgi:outer membrane protein assembly factor BamB
VLTFAVSAFLGFTAASWAAGKADDNWPCFRGHARSGIASAGNDAVPLEWSDTQNIVWKTALPGRGASSPIVWGDSIFLTAYTGYGLEKNDPPANMSKLVRHLLCIDRRDGKVRWQAEEPARGVDEHTMSGYTYLHGYASSTPVADASGVYVYFGRAGVFAFDHAGVRRWHFPLGGRDHNWGSASSPILFENLLIVHADPEKQSLFGLDKATGREVWRVPTGDGDSWSTPLVLETGGRHELVFHHTDAYHTPRRTAHVAAVNPRTGEPLWECTILKDYLCPSPVAGNGVVYWLAHQNGAAVRAGGKGDVTGSHRLWTTTRGTEIGTPILHEDHLYWAHEENGMAYCLDAKTGAITYQERLSPTPGRLYASGVLVAGRIYFVSRERGTFVVEAKPKFRQLAHNRIESDTSLFNGTPAISHGQMFLRSDRFLYCLGKK